jgi:hydrogenase maturation protease
MTPTATSSGRSDVADLADLVPGEPAPGTLIDTIVIGLGNPILGDDGVAWRVVDAVEARIGAVAAASITVRRLAVGGLALMEQLCGSRRAVVIDALLDDAGHPGSVVTLSLDEAERHMPGHLDSAHDVTLSAAIDAGRMLGAALPDEVMVVGIRVVVTDVFGEALSPAVEAAVPVAADAVFRLLGDREGSG